MDEDVTYILLYELLHGHQNFLSYALSRTDIDELVCKPFFSFYIFIFAN